jgi:hypothetical protein
MVMLRTLFMVCRLVREFSAPTMPYRVLKCKIGLFLTAGIDTKMNARTICYARN